MGSSLFRQGKNAEGCLKPNPEEGGASAEVGYAEMRSPPCRNDKKAGGAMLDRNIVDFMVYVFLSTFAIYLFFIRSFDWGVLLLLLLIYLVLTKGGERDGWGGVF